MYNPLRDKNYIRNPQRNKKLNSLRDKNYKKFKLRKI